jgi:hypothetical protein
MTATTDTIAFHCTMISALGLRVLVELVLAQHGLLVDTTMLICSA